MDRTYNEKEMVKRLVSTTWETLHRHCVFVIGCEQWIERGLHIDGITSEYMMECVRIMDVLCAVKKLNIICGYHLQRHLDRAVNIWWSLYLHLSTDGMCYFDLSLFVCTNYDACVYREKTVAWSECSLGRNHRTTPRCVYMFAIYIYTYWCLRVCEFACACVCACTCARVFA